MKKFVGIALMVTFSLWATAGDELDQIKGVIAQGNVTELAKWLDSSVEIAILKESNVYSAAQATQILKDFFSKHKPTSFQIIHRGASGGGDARYGIGSYVSASGTFRTYIFLKQSGSSFKIQEIRFEAD